MPDNFYRLETGQYNQPKVKLFSPDDASAEIYLSGGHLTSWIPGGGQEQLFLSPLSKFGDGAAIRGGIPVIFPQFSGEGPLPKHGFVRKQLWEFVEAQEQNGNAIARFQLHDNQTTRAIWPHAFWIDLEILIGGQELRVKFRVTNTGASTFAFTTALHTYLKVNDIANVAIEGLGGLTYLDTVGERISRVQQESELNFDREVDRIYYHAPSQLILSEGSRRLKIENSGFPDTVIWNPWAELSGTLPDMEPEGYRRMVCIEAVVAGSPVKLAPGQSWSGYQRLRAVTL
jgi:glucose-6-phosphate 1-epimerase